MGTSKQNLMTIDSLAFAFMYVGMDFLVYTVFYFINTIALVVIYCNDLLCYSVYRPQSCKKNLTTDKAVHKKSNIQYKQTKCLKYHFFTIDVYWQ